MLFALFGAAILSSTAHADPYRPQLSVQAPTERMSGAPLALSELAEFRVYCDDNPAPVDSFPPGGPVSSWLSAPGTFQPGSHVCYMTAVDTAGNESGPSNTANFTVIPDAPGAPVIGNE